MPSFVTLAVAGGAAAYLYREQLSTLFPEDVANVLLALREDLDDILASLSVLASRHLPSSVLAFLAALSPFAARALAAVAALTPSDAWRFLGVWVLGMFLFRTFVEGKRNVPAPVPKGWAGHFRDAQLVHNEFAHYLRHRAAGEKVSINRSKNGHSDSNRTQAADYKLRARRVDVSALDQVVAFDTARGLMHIEPGLPMDELARVAIANGFVPQVVLEFPGITAGGALCGGGIESTSHKFGSFYDTVEEVDIITGDGVMRRAVSRTNEPDLFAALATSYGTHGILTRIAVRVDPAPRYVRVRYLHMAGMDPATKAMEALANEQNAPEFIDGVAMSPTSAVVVLGDGCDEPPTGVPFVSLRSSRYDPWFFWHLTSLARRLPALPFAGAPAAAAGASKGGKKGAAASSSSSSSDGPSLRSLAGHEEYMSLEDYLFRFDRGAFWMARHGLQVFYGPFAYNSNPTSDAGPNFFIRVMYAWLATTRQLYRMLHAIGDEGVARFYVVQDYIMPGPAEATALSRFTHDPANGLQIWPLWVCPVRMVDKRHPYNPGFGFPVQRTAPQGLMVNVGVYGMPNEGRPFDPVVVNKALETEASRLEGRKMLYAQSFYTDAEFWSLFDRKAYDSIRKTYGGETIFPDIATKLLLGKRVDAMRGAKAVSFASCAGSMAAWYFSLWQEVAAPRALHAWLGLQFTGMTAYARTATAGGSA
jgi:Delta24-sterol reductase